MASLIRERVRWQLLPYGKYICRDGREVLFNRDYQPIWQRTDGIVTMADPREWVDYMKQEWFHHSDRTPDRTAVAIRAYEAFTGKRWNWIENIHKVRFAYNAHRRTKHAMRQILHCRPALPAEQDFAINAYNEHAHETRFVPGLFEMNFRVLDAFDGDKHIRLRIRSTWGPSRPLTSSDLKWFGATCGGLEYVAKAKADREYAARLKADLGL